MRLKKRVFRNVANKVKPWKRARAKWMSRHQTWPERILWARLKDKQLGVWFYKQKLFLGFILDFFCPACALCLEIDGKSHDRRKAYDANRDLVLKSRGVLTMRFKAGEVNNNVAAVVAIIRDRVCKRVRRGSIT